jgi:hypothetical protein
MQTSKELLSQNEIKALLEVLSAPSKDESTSTLSFEWRMAKVANSIRSYLDGFTCTFDDAKVSKETTQREDLYTYETSYPYLKSLQFDNTLALQIIASRFGAEDPAIMERPLSTLEEHLLEDVCKEIVYIVEKELDEIILGLEEPLSYRELHFYSSDHVMKLGFCFESPTVLSKEVYLDNTVVEAIVGRIDTAVIERGEHYRVLDFENRSVVLMFDKTLSFKALKSSRNRQSFSYVLQDALESTIPLSSYYVVIGRSILEDEAYMSLSKGSTLKLLRLMDAEIHKDGRIVSKAKLKTTNGEMAIEVI